MVNKRLLVVVASQSRLSKHRQQLGAGWGVGWIPMIFLVESITLWFFKIAMDHGPLMIKLMIYRTKKTW